MLKKFALLGTLLFGLFASTQSSFAKQLETAIFAGGCFWCVESDFDHVPGVVSTVSGYTGGEGKDPTYKTYISKGHIEAVKITYDADIISFKKLLDVFWYSVDPTDAGGQFCDRGHGYITAIFANNDKQRKVAQKSRAALAAMHPDKMIVTSIYTAGKFYNAERYHQGYAARNPLRYGYYRRGCGRDARVMEVWGKLAHRGIQKH